ncbi:MAG: hypothetical protein HY360_18730, partial [Verrucomicrobia bacterium]|nr:hypothetical protein [Verrucomicrobiota bacterium]
AATYDAATSNAVLYVDGIAEATGVITNWNRTAPHPTATVKSFVFGFSPSLSRPGGDTIHHPPSTFPHNDDDEDDDESDSDDEDRAIASPSTIPAAADRNSPFSILHSSFLLDEARLYNIALSSNEILDLPNTFADPDNDGLSNLDEYRQGADPTRPDTDGDGVLDGADALPLDYYNGVLPNLAIVGGNNQSGLPETLLTEPLTVRVADTANQPLVSAPVTFAISQGGGQLAPMTNLMVRASSLAIRSSANGEASARFYLPAVFGTNVITVSAVSGTLTRSVQLTAVAEDPIPPEISILSPTNGLMTTNLVINLEGNVTDNDRLASVGVTFNTLALTNLVGLATNSMTLNIPLNLLDGTNTVDVVAQDRFGNTNAVSVAFVKGQLDSDGDGIPDDWEKKYFGDLSQDAQDDTDHDGLTNLEEFAADTDPTKTDTDGDGLPDAWEVNNGTNPLANDATADPDHDGVPNSIEFLQGRNPQKGAVADTTGAVSLQVYTLLE